MHVTYNSTMAIPGLKEGIAHIKSMPLDIWVPKSSHRALISYIIWMTAPITFFGIISMALNPWF